MSDCKVYYADGTTRQVKNLGWIMRHSSEVTLIVLILLPNNRARFTAFLSRIGSGRQYKLYQTDWVDYGLARDFVNRKRFSAAEKIYG
jgi:hypothetical protein